MIDPRTLAPLDPTRSSSRSRRPATSCSSTRRPRHSSVSAVIAGDVAEHGFSSLKAPIRHVTALDTTVPYSEPIEAYVLPDEDKVVDAVRKTLQTVSA